MRGRGWVSVAGARTPVDRPLGSSEQRGGCAGAGRCGGGHGDALVFHSPAAA